ncbi:MAG TPA: hypothetical protein DHU69_01375 [Deltaproteobacteria bacterium]|nr:hypothetical protein [Deltaproteobacteria bacterium]HCY18422.1 hypothetical protein [Deltaproteobacteria bacterium]
MKISINRKILGLFLTLVVIVAIFVSGTYYVTRYMQKALHKSDIISRGVNLTGNLQFQINKLLFPVSRYLITGDIEERDNFDIIISEISRLLSEIKSLGGDWEWNEVSEKVEKDAAAFGEKAINILYIDKPVGNNVALKLMAELSSSSDLLVQEVDKFHRFAENEVSRMGVQVNKVAVESNIYAVTVLVMLILSTVLLYYYLKKFVTIPIYKLHEGANIIAKGDLDHNLNIRTGDELEELSSAFNKMAFALKQDRAKLMKELDVFNALLKILGLLISIPKMQDVLHRIVDAIRNLILCDTCSIMLLDVKREFLTVQASYGLDERYVQGAIQRMGDGIAGWVALHRKPLLLNGPIQEGQFNNYMEHEKNIVSSIAIPIETKDGIIGVVCISMKSEYEYTKDDERRLLLIVRNLAIAMENAHLFEELEKTNLETIMALAQALETRDAYTRGHTERTARLALAIAERLELPEKTKERLKYAAILHDIGKIGIPDNILNKPGKLTDEEYTFIKQHSIRGAEIVKQVDALKLVATIILHHHERWDGSGYPDGLKGEKIPIEARIVSVLDAFDAMTSDRPYRRALTVEVAIAELKRCSGTQFDPKVIDAFMAEIQPK